MDNKFSTLDNNALVEVFETLVEEATKQENFRAGGMTKKTERDLAQAKAELLTRLKRE